MITFPVMLPKASPGRSKYCVLQRNYLGTSKIQLLQASDEGFLRFITQI